MRDVEDVAGINEVLMAVVRWLEQGGDREGYLCWARGFLVLDVIK